jgi:hypothetical protein
MRRTRGEGGRFFVVTEWRFALPVADFFAVVDLWEAVFFAGVCVSVLLSPFDVVCAGAFAADVSACANR